HEDFRLRSLRAWNRLHALRVEGEVFTVDLQRGFGTAKLDTAVVDVVVERPIEGNVELTGEFVGRRDGVGPLPLHDVNVAGRGGRLRRGLTHIPLDDVDPMGEQVGENSTAKVPKEPPPHEFLRRKLLVGGEAQKLLPVEPGSVNLGQAAPPAGGG